MQLSEMWLRELSGVKNELSTLRDQLTNSGLEVEAIIPVAQAFSSVVIGGVITKSPHPDADRLNICMVEVGGAEKLQIVCGAKNVAVGQKVPVALVGAKLSGDFEIKKAKIRGIESCGMICSKKELGFDAEDEGIWVLSDEAPIAQDFREYLQLNDSLITLGIGPNRGDCLSMVGLAREIAAANAQKFKFPEIIVVKPEIPDEIAVKVETPEACPIYVSRVIRGLSKEAKSPHWLQERLHRMGAKSMHPAVDVTNYVMYFLGQAMHAFDLQKIQGNLSVGKISEAQLKAEVSLALLDGTTKRVQENTLLISDDQGPLALAGIMGGARSAVNDKTCDVLLEAAHFIPSAIAGMPRKYGMNSESSHRFERGIDPALPEKAMELATQLLISIAGGKPGPIKIHREKLPEAKRILVNLDRIKRRLGIPSLEMAWILKTLDLIDLNPRQKDSQTLIVTVPSHRFDLSIEEDIAEEIARLYGLNQIEAVLPSAPFVSDELSETHQTDQVLASFLANRGWMQTLHYSFIDPQWQKIFYADLQPPTLRNPIASDMAQMRASLLPGLLSSAIHNLNRQVNRLSFFEMGQIFLDEVREESRLALVKVGWRDPEHWSGTASVDFFDLKGDLEALFEYCQIEVKFLPIQEISYLHPHQAAEIQVQGKRIGLMGALHPRIQQQLGIKSSVFVAECDQAVFLNRPLPKFKEISKYPSIRRDLAIVLDQAVLAGEVIETCQKTLGNLLIDINVFDVYSGKNIEAGKKSLALSLILQELNKTLVEEEINQAMAKVLKNLESQFRAKLRE